MKNYLLSAIAVSLLFISCKKDSTETTANEDNVKYIKSVVPDKIDQLYEFRGDKASDTVWVFLQGGPDFKMNYELESESSDKPYDYFLDDLRVYPYQIQHLNKSIRSATDFTYEDAIIDTDLSIKITKDVIMHFKNQNKVVYLIGHSYGAFMTQKILADYGNIADKSAVLNCRLNIEKSVREGFKMGKVITYNENGENPTEVNLEETAKKEGFSPLEAKNTAIIGAPIINFNFLELLKDADLSKTFFVGAKNDSAVGDWTTEELTFLNKKAGMVFFGDGDHSSIFNYDGMKTVHAFLIGKLKTIPPND